MNTSFMQLHWLWVIVIGILSTCTSLEGQDMHIAVSAILDTSKNSMTVEATIDILPSEPDNRDTLWFYLPVYAYVERNNTFNEDILKSGQTDFYFRNKSHVIEVKKMVVGVDGKEVKPFSIPGTEAFIGILSESKSVHFSYTVILPEWHFGPSYRESSYLLQDFFPIPATKDFQTYRYPRSNVKPNVPVVIDLQFPEGYVAFSNGNLFKNDDKNTIKIEGVDDLAIIVLRKSLSGGGSFLSTIGSHIPFYADTKLMQSDHFLNGLDTVWQQLTQDLGSYPYQSLILKTSRSKYITEYRNGFVLAPEPTKTVDIKNWLTLYLTRLWVEGKFKLKNPKDNWLLDGITNFIVKQGKTKFLLSDLELLKNYDNQGLLPSFDLDDDQLSREQIYLKHQVMSTIYIDYLASSTSESALRNVLKGWKSEVQPLTEESLIAALERESNKSMDVRPKSMLKHSKDIHFNSLLQEGYHDNCSLVSSLLKLEHPVCNPLKWAIYPAYNDNDGWLAGMTFSNTHPYQYKDFTWTLSPMYSFWHNKFVGQAWAKYDVKLKTEKLDKVRFSLGLKSFDMDYNKKFEYARQYIKVSPSIQWFFSHPLVSGIQSSFSVRWLKLSEQEANFKHGQFIGLGRIKSNIFQMTYDWERDKTLSNTSFSLVAEYQGYSKADQYIKFTGTGKHQWMYNSNKYIGIRLFAGGFILNTQRKVNSFQNQLTRGSLALIQHGFNDYAYEEYFLARQSQNGFQDRQVSMTRGGGFKTPVGSAYNIGMSNNYAASLNLFIDMPFKTKWFPLQAYFDMGVYSRYFNQRFTNSTIYNSGIMLNYSDVVAIYIPLVYSDELGSIYKEVHKNFFSRISFGINLHQFKFWQK